MKYKQKYSRVRDLKSHHMIFSMESNITNSPIKPIQSRTKIIYIYMSMSVCVCVCVCVCVFDNYEMQIRMIHFFLNRSLYIIMDCCYNWTP